jgi:hypothetical protein
MVLAVVVVAMTVVAVVTKPDKKVVEVVMTTITIVAAIEIKKSTRTLLAISIVVFLLVTSAVTSLVMLMTARLTRTYAAASMTPNTAPWVSNSLLPISDKSPGQGISSLRSSENMTARKTLKAGSRSTRSPSDLP